MLPLPTQHAVISTERVQPLLGLQSYWGLEEASGQRNDSHGTAHLTDTNTVTGNPGIVGSAGQFTAATTEYLTTADTSGLSVGENDFTIAAWAYLDSKGAEGVIASKFVSSSSGEFILRYLSTLDRFQWLVVTTAASLPAVQSDLIGVPALATWYFLIATWESRGWRLGLNVNNTGMAWARNNVPVQDSVASFQIGARNGALPWNGRIDEVGFWRRCLNASEQSWLWNGGRGRSYAELAAWRG